MTAPTQSILTQGEGETLDGILALSGDRYSPNLRKWLVRQRRWRPHRDLPAVFIDPDRIHWIGWMDEESWFVGTRLMRALVDGAKADAYAHVPRFAKTLMAELGFWSRYATVGRCAVDPDHRIGFVGDETRWAVNGDSRSCLWCNNHHQTLRRWSETIERTRWEPAAPAGDA